MDKGLLKELAPLLYVLVGALLSIAWKLFNQNLEKKESDFDDFKNKLLEKIDKLTDSMNNIAKALGIIETEVRHLSECLDKQEQRIDKVDNRIEKIEEKCQMIGK